MTASAATENVVGVLAPYGRDGAVAARVLEEQGFAVQVVGGIPELCALVRDGIGIILIAEEALDANARAAVLAELQAQPTWSDVPIIVMIREGELSKTLPRGLQSLAERTSVTLLERPVRLATLVTTLRSAMRARQRQYDVRDYIRQRERTEHTLRENEIHLREARQSAEEANLAKARFLATMSHELRTPLNAIAGYTELLSMGVHGPITNEQRADLDRIERSQRYLLSLINDVLNFSKIEAGHVAFALQNFRIDPLLRSLEAFVSPQLKAKNIRYSYSTEHPHCTALADEEKTQQILLNLLSNATKFTPTDGQIDVVCSASPGKVIISVSDSGPGIPADKIETIFEPFVQLDRSLTRTGVGTGLGLSISRDLARKMSGDLTVESTPGAGSTFTLTLPQGSEAKSP